MRHERGIGVIVTGIDGKQYKFNPKQSRGGTRSKLAQEALSLLKKIFPCEIIIEEVKIPGSALFFDFYLTNQKTFVEVQGAQHTEYVHHFHGDKRSFTKATRRDSLKQQWCENNNFSLVELSHDNRDQWERMLRNC